ncbi:MAG: hypothetical protein HC819_09980 [Cyclobacteriaceae bacterium]|nr:hypothetical protein [Cyclobacteriaceae bacterium]
MEDKTITGFLVVFTLILALALTGCGREKKKTMRLEKFDSETWIADKNGCSGTRLSMKNQILLLKYDMRGLKTDEIESYLGHPDAQELYDRSQRYYIYLIEPGSKCPNAKENPQALFVRFSAVGIANEFTIKPM